MTRRTNYRNGDEITLTACGCDGCSPSRINGVLCHEHGCTEAWRDSVRECRECGCHFKPEDRNQQFCSPCCRAAHFGGDCECESCVAARAEEADAGELDAPECDEEDGLAATLAAVGRYRQDRTCPL